MTLDAPEFEAATDALDEPARDDASLSDRATDTAPDDVMREDLGVDASIDATDANAPDASDGAPDAPDISTDTAMDAPPDVAAPDTPEEDAFDATSTPDVVAPDAAPDVPPPDAPPPDAPPLDVECPAGALRLGAIRDFTRGTWTLLRPDALIVGHDDGGLFTFDAMCTHAGCVVSPPDARGESECGCHGSRFDGIGAVLRGPATIALAHYELVRCGDGLFVTDRTVKASARLAR